MRKIQVIDSHTGGEPTRVVIAGGPHLGSWDMAGRLAVLHSEYDRFRRSVINEPRGWEAMVGALLCEPIEPECTSGVIFFNNVGYLGMCVHGMIGVVATLAYQQRIEPGEHRFETPVGEVIATLYDDGRVAVRNVDSYRSAKDVAIHVPILGDVVGDVAWGGNWFFLVNSFGAASKLPLGLGDPIAITPSSADMLTEMAWTLRQGLKRENITGDDGAEIDHIEFFAKSLRPDADSKNFVLCPGKAYDRSPCGTGTSAKVACLYADGKLKPGDVWRQESITGSIFEASIEVDPADALRVIPTVTGSAFVTAESTLLLDPDDPFREGIGGANI